MKPSMDATVPIWDLAPPTLKWAQKVAYLAHQFSRMNQVETPVESRFEPGVYVRTMRIPKDTLFVGRRHTVGHEVLLLEGRVWAVFPTGPQELEAPFTMHSPPDFHAVFYAVTDVVGQTRHPNPTESRDVAALEDHYFEPAAELIERGRLIHQRLLT